MPSVRTVKNKFEEFKTTLSASRDKLKSQNTAYSEQIRQQREVFANGFVGILDNLSEVAQQRLQECLNKAGVEIDVSEFIQSKKTKNDDLKAEAADIDSRFEGSESVEDKLGTLKAELALMQKEELPAGQSEMEALTEKFADVAKYNQYAAELSQELVTSENAADFVKSWLWHCTAGLANPSASKVSKYLKTLSDGEFQREFKKYEDQETAIDDLKTAIQAKKAEIANVQEASEHKENLLNRVLDDSEIAKSLARIIKDELRSNKALCSHFTEEFEDKGQAIVLALSKSVALEKFSESLGGQISELDKAIRKIEAPMSKLRRAASRNGSKNVRVDLDKIERSIKEGSLNIGNAIEGLSSRLNKINNFKPSNDDGGMFFNYLLIYILVADGLFDGADTTNISDLALADAFGGAMPDLSSLDMGTFELANLTSLDLGGLDIPNFDVSVPIDSLSGLSGLDSISTIDVGSSMGGFDGGAMGGF